MVDDTCMLIDALHSDSRERGALDTVQALRRELHDAQARPALLGSWDTFQGPSQTRM